MFAERKGEGRTRADREADDQQVLQLEEKDVVSSVANVLSDSCGPGEYMAMEKLHSVVSSMPSLLLDFYVRTNVSIHLINLANIYSVPTFCYITEPFLWS